MSFGIGGGSGVGGSAGSGGGGSSGPSIDIGRFDNVTSGLVDAIKTSVATTTSAVTYSGAQLNGSIGEDPIDPYGRTFTVTTTAAAPGTYNTTDPVVFNAIDYDMVEREIRVYITSSSAAATYESVFADGIGYAAVSIERPPQGGAGGAMKFGVGDTMGLPSEVKFSGFYAVLLAHSRNGTAGTAGDISINGPAATPPFGSISYGTPPAGDTDIVTYEKA